MSPFIPFDHDEKQFHLMRHHLLGQPTLRQSQVALNAKTADIDNEQTDDQYIQTNPAMKNTTKN